MKRVQKIQALKSMSSVQIRRARLQDLDTLVDQRHSMFEAIRPRPPSEHRVGDRAYRKFVPEMMHQGRFAAFLATTKKGSAVAGACIWVREIQPHPEKTSPKKAPYLMSVYTTPKYRGLGLATRLVKEATK